jgi:hypothetical protein
MSSVFARQLRCVQKAAEGSISTPVTRDAPAMFLKTAAVSKPLPVPTSRTRPGCSAFAIPAYPVITSSAMCSVSMLGPKTSSSSRRST